MQVAAHAKVNFTLEVFGERADGFHALRSLVVPISLADALDVQTADEATITSDSPYPDDLCIKAAFKLRERAIAAGVADAKNLGASISVKKRIPAGGGLGGGSADAAATLNALNTLWKLDFPLARLLEIAAEVGSDVPALTLGGAVIMEGRGEKVEKFGTIPPLYLVLANPGVFSSTKEVYKKCQARLTDAPEILHNMRSALGIGNLDAISAAMVNDLAFPAVSLYPQIATALEAMRQAGIKRPMMSGSGSTVFGLVPNEAEGRKSKALLEAQGFAAWCVHTFCPVM